MEKHFQRNIIADGYMILLFLYAVQSQVNSEAFQNDSKSEFFYSRRRFVVLDSFQEDFCTFEATLEDRFLWNFKGPQKKVE